jgi:hypothetical protein
MSDVFDRLHAEGKVSSEAYHPDRPDDWSPDVHKAVTEPAADQEGARQERDDSGRETRTDGAPLHAQSFYGSVNDLSPAERQEMQDLDDWHAQDLRQFLS